MRYNQIKIQESDDDYTMIDGVGVTDAPLDTSKTQTRVDDMVDSYNQFGRIKRNITDYKYKAPGPNIKSFKEVKAAHESGDEGYKVIPNFIKDQQWHDIHGFNFAGTDEEAALLATGIEDQAKLWNVPPRAFTNNQSNIITTGSQPTKKNDGFGQEQITLGSQSPGYTRDYPFMSHINLGEINPKYMSKTFPHEWAHHLSMNMASVDAVGGMRVGNKHKRNVQFNSPENYITGFGIGPYATRDYLNIIDQSRGRDGLMDVTKVRGDLFNQFMYSQSNKQRPELKKAQALMTSMVLSDEHLLHHAESSPNSWPKEYRFHPEEQFARALTEYARLSQLPENERFNGNNNIINKDTYDAIQYWSDTKKVINGNTIAKVKPGNNNKLA